MFKKLFNEIQSKIQRKGKKINLYINSSLNTGSQVQIKSTVNKKYIKLTENELQRCQLAETANENNTKCITDFEQPPGALNNQLKQLNCPSKRNIKHISLAITPAQTKDPKVNPNARINIVSSCIAG